MSEARLLALVVLAFLAFAVGLLALLSVLPATRAAARGLWPAMVSELVIAAAALVLVVPGGIVGDAGIALLAGRCAWEAAVVVLGEATRRDRALVLGAAAALAALAARHGGGPGAMLGAVLVGTTAFAATWTRGAGAKTEAGLLVLFPLLPLVAFAAVSARPDGAAILLVAFLLVETMDSSAVLGGRLFGRHKVFPRLSPRKTVEGLLAGAVAVAAAAVLLGLAVMDWSPGRIGAVALSVAVATVAGDLTASALKRRAGVKDYPVVHAVQGGALDVVDAWIVAAPVLALVSSLA